MRLVARRIRVVVVVRDAARGVQGARFEHLPVAAVADGDVEPDAARRVGGRELVPGEVFHRHLRLQAPGAHLEAADGDPGRFRLELGERLLRRGGELVRGRLHAELVAVPVQDPVHEKVAPRKGVPGHPRARHPQDAADGGLLLHHRHVARLAAQDLPVGAVGPFLVGDLFGEFPQVLPRRSQGVGIQGVAARAGLTLPEVGGLHRTEAPGGTGHDPRVPRLGGVGAEDLALPGGIGSADDEAADESLPRPQLVFGDLVAEGAGHPVPRQLVLRASRDEPQVGEDRPLLPRPRRLVARHRHVADRAFVLDPPLGRRVLHRFAPDARLPVGVPGRVGHHGRPPGQAHGDVLPAPRRQVVVARHAAVGSLKPRDVDLSRGAGNQCRDHSRRQRRSPQTEASLRHPISTHRTHSRRTCPTSGKRGPRWSGGRNR